MFRTLTAIVLLFIVALGPSATAFADKQRPKNASGASELVGTLPASDIVVSFDSDRFLNESLPQILASNQPLYNEIVGKIDQIQKSTGFDLRQLDQLAMGLTVRPTADNKAEYDPLMLARGRFNSDGLVAVVALVADGKARQEIIADRTVYIFTPLKIDRKESTEKKDMLSQILDAILNGLDREMALTAYDDKTIAVGTPDRVREVLERKSRVSEEMLAEFGQGQKAVMKFAGTMPSGLSKFIDLGNDSLGKTLSGIRFISGAMDTNAAGVDLVMSARMETPEQATNMKDLLVGFQALFSGILSAGKSQDKSNDMLGRTLKNIKISRLGRQVSMALSMPQRDVATLVSAKS